MNHVIIPPPPELAHLVKCFWSFETNVPPGRSLMISTFVNDSTGMTFVLDKTNPLFRATVEGQSVRPRVYTPVSSVNAMGVQFQTGVLPHLFRFDANEFIDQEISLSDLYKSDLQEKLLEANSSEKRIQLLCAFIKSLNRRDSRLDPLIASSLESIRVECMPRVHELLKTLGVSERQLERKFLKSIGVTPRHFLSVARFQRTLHYLKRTHDPYFTTLCFDMGYYDQAHFTKDIRRLSGYTPKELHRKLMKHAVNQKGSTSYLIEIADTQNTTT